MIEDDANSTIFGIVLGLVMIVGIFMDWSSGPADSISFLNSNGGPPIISASSENKSSAKKQDSEPLKKQSIEPVKKQGIEPVKKIIVEPTLKPDNSNYSKSTKSPQTGETSGQDN